MTRSKPHRTPSSRCRTGSTYSSYAHGEQLGELDTPAKTTGNGSVVALATATSEQRNTAGVVEAAAEVVVAITNTAPSMSLVGVSIVKVVRVPY